jgi:hypothetical protein
MEILIVAILVIGSLIALISQSSKSRRNSDFRSFHGDGGSTSGGSVHHHHHDCGCDGGSGGGDGGGGGGD